MLWTKIFRESVRQDILIYVIANPIRIGTFLLAESA